jgi:hypothetical protein
MKKFISFGATIALLLFVSSCREVDEITTLPDIPISAKKDSSEVETSIPTLENSNVTVEEKKDPPPKDKVEW